MRDRVVWIDGMKGLGILLVMLSHFCHVPSLLIAGYMPLFFFTSGITYKPSTSFRTVAEKKSKRLLIPWFFYGSFIFATDILYSIFAHKFSWILLTERLTGLVYMRSSFSWPYDFPTQGNLLSSNGPMWFLPTMFLVCMYMVFYEWCKRKWLFVVGLFALTVATYKIPIQFPWGLELALMGILFLLAAIPIRKHIVLRKDSMGGAFLPLICFVSLTLYALLGAYNGRVDMMFRDYGNHGYLSVLLFLVCGLFYSMVVMSFCIMAEKTKLINALAYLGKNSLRLLCIHFFIQGYSIPVLWHIVPSSVEWSELLTATVFIVEVVLINAILQKFIDKYQPHCSILKWI